MKADAKTLSLKRLSTDFGLDVLSLPIHIFNSDLMDGTPAYIDPSGIHLARSVVELEPQNIHVYLGHEILHSVIHNDEETGGFLPKLVNVAEDYKINQFLYEVLGYDVRKVLVRGLFSSKYKRMTVVGVCNCLAKDVSISGLTPCKTKWSHHPLVFEQALRLRVKFEQHFAGMGAKPTEFFHLDPVDSKPFHLSVGSLASKVFLHDLKGVNVNRTVHGLWAHLYLDKLVAVEPETPAINTPQSLVWGMPGDRMRVDTQSRMDISILAAVNYLKRVDADQLHLRALMAQGAHRARNLEYSIKSAQSVLKRAKTVAERKEAQTHLLDLRGKLVETKAYIERVRAIVPLTILLNTRQVQMRATAKTTVTKRQCLANEHLKALDEVYREEVKLPNFDRADEIIKRLRALGAQAVDKAEKTGELAKELERQFGPLMKDEGKGDGEPEAGKKGPPGKGDSGQGPSQEAGTGQPPPATRIEALFAIQALEDKLLNILAKMREIETMLSRKHSPRTTEIGNEQVLLGYGNDLERIVPSELALMSSEKTKLAFFAKYAEHSLLQVNPTEKRRYPVVFCIDGSGSMSGDFYLTAVGFVLAMCKRLHQDKRGAAFILFSGGVDQVLVVKPDEPFNLMRLVMMLSKPSFGGTEFGPAFSRAYEIKELEKWKSMATMLVTDGYGQISNLDELKERKSQLDRWVGVIVSKGNPKIEGLDECWSVSKSGMLQQLVASGASLL